MTTATAPDEKVLVGLTHADDDAESVLIAYLVGVESLRAGKAAAMWLTKDGVKVAQEGFASSVDVEGGPSIADLHDEYVRSGGRFIACPVCVKLRGYGDEPLAQNAEIGGVPTMLAFTEGGALVFNY